MHPNLVAVAGPTRVELFRLEDATIRPVLHVAGHASDASWHATMPACVVALGYGLHLLRIPA